MVEVARFMLGDLRFGRPFAHSAPAIPSPESIAPVVVDEREGASGRPQVARRSEPAPADREQALSDEADVERAIRDRLYGDVRRHRR
jgi:hypothetical protein